MPSTPGFPAERPSALRPAARREIPSFDSAESASITLAASAAFQEVITFGGRPDAIVIDASAGALEIRFRNRGETARAPIRIQSAGERRYDVSYEIVEARDPAAAGGQFITATGRYASRDIDVRNTFPGPRQAGEFRSHADLATQIKHPE